MASLRSIPGLVKSIAGTLTLGVIGSLITEKVLGFNFLKLFVLPITVPLWVLLAAAGALFLCGLLTAKITKMSRNRLPDTESDTDSDDGAPQLKPSDGLWIDTHGNLFCPRCFANNKQGLIKIVEENTAEGWSRRVCQGCGKAFNKGNPPPPARSESRTKLWNPFDD
jgi:hypothetical protein